MRLAFVPPSKLTSEQLPLYEDMKACISAKYGAFTTMRDDGMILGPWSAWPHDPKFGAAIWSVTKAMTSFRHLPEVSPRIVILVVGARFLAAYEIYAHSAVAGGVGVAKDQIATIAAGKRPADLSEEAQVAHDVAANLLNGGVLAEAAYRRAIGLFRQLAVAELIYLIGHCRFVSMTLNGFDISVPDGDSFPEENDGLE
jgi:4-carboxymuconolactone decarboxylase